MGADQIREDRVCDVAENETAATRAAVKSLERVMGIESKPAPLVSNQLLTCRLGRNFDTLDDTFGTTSVADTLCLHQRRLRTGSDQARALRCRPIRAVHSLRLGRRLQALLQRLLLVDGRDVLAALLKLLTRQLRYIADGGLRPWR